MKDTLITSGASAVLFTPDATGFTLYSVNEPSIVIEPALPTQVFNSNVTKVQLTGPGAAAWKTRVDITPTALQSLDDSDPTLVTNLNRYVVTVDGRTDRKVSGAAITVNLSEQPVFSNSELPIEKDLYTSGGQIPSRQQTPGGEYIYTPGVYYSASTVGLHVVVEESPVEYVTGSSVVLILPNEVKRGSGAVFKGPWCLDGTSVHKPVFCTYSAPAGWTDSGGNIAGTNGVADILGQTLTASSNGYGLVSYTQPPHANYFSDGTSFAVHGDNALLLSGARVFHTVGKLSNTDTTVYDESDVDAPHFLYSAGSGYMLVTGQNTSHFVSGADVKPITHVAFPYYPLTGDGYLPLVGSFCDQAPVALADIYVDAGGLIGFDPYVIGTGSSALYLVSRHNFTPEVFNYRSGAHATIGYSADYSYVSTVNSSSINYGHYHNNFYTSEVIPGESEKVLLEFSYKKELDNNTLSKGNCDWAWDTVGEVKSTFSYESKNGTETANGKIYRGGGITWNSCPQVLIEHVSCTVEGTRPSGEGCDGWAESLKLSKNRLVYNPQTNYWDRTWFEEYWEESGGTWSDTGTDIATGPIYASTISIRPPGCNNSDFRYLELIPYGYVPTQRVSAFIPVDGSELSVEATYSEDTGWCGIINTYHISATAKMVGDSTSTPPSESDLPTDITEIQVNKAYDPTTDMITLTATYGGETATATGPFPGPVSLIKSWDTFNAGVDPCVAQQRTHAYVSVYVSGGTEEPTSKHTSRFIDTVSSSFSASISATHERGIPDHIMYLENAATTIPSLYSKYTGIYVGGPSGAALLAPLYESSHPYSFVLSRYDSAVSSGDVQTYTYLSSGGNVTSTAELNPEYIFPLEEADIVNGIEVYSNRNINNSLVTPLSAAVNIYPVKSGAVAWNGVVWPESAAAPKYGGQNCKQVVSGAMTAGCIKRNGESEQTWGTTVPPTTDPQSYDPQVPAVNLFRISQLYPRMVLPTYPTVADATTLICSSGAVVTSGGFIRDVRVVQMSANYSAAKLSGGYDWYHGYWSDDETQESANWSGSADFQVVPVDHAPWCVSGASCIDKYLISGGYVLKDLTTTPPTVISRHELREAYVVAEPDFSAKIDAALACYEEGSALFMAKLNAVSGAIDTCSASVKVSEQASAALNSEGSLISGELMVESTASIHSGGIVFLYTPEND